MDRYREYFFHRPPYRLDPQGSVKEQVEGEKPVELPFIKADLVDEGFQLSLFVSRQVPSPLERRVNEVLGDVEINLDFNQI